VNAPAVVIRIELERRPVVYVEAGDDGEDARLRDWVTAHPRYAALVARARALELEAQEPAA
jgi:hypothetical protein